MGCGDLHFQQAFQLISSVQFSLSVVSDSVRPHESQHARPPCPSPTIDLDTIIYAKQGPWKLGLSISKGRKK